MKISDKIQKQIEVLNNCRDLSCYDSVQKIELENVMLGLSRAKLIAMHHEYCEEREQEEKESNSTAKPRYGRWISVEDELPNKNDWVVVWGSDEGCFLGLGRIAIKKGIYKGNGGRRFGNSITHWMPLPEPPNSSKNSNS